MEPKKVKLEGVERYTRLLGGSPETAGMKSGFVTLNPGESVGQHSTADREEAIVILEGSAEVVINGEPVFAAGGHHLVYIPPQTPHDILNTGTLPLRYVYVVAPVG